MVDFIELSAKGVLEVQAQIDALKDSTKGATDAAVVMNKALQDPRNRGAIRSLETIRQLNLSVLQVERQRAALTVRSEQTYGRGALAAVRQELDLKRQLSKVEADHAQLRRAAAQTDARANGLADARERVKLNQQMLRDERELARFKRVAQSQHDATPDGRKQVEAAARLAAYAKQKAAVEAAAAKEAALQSRLAQSSGAAGLATAKERMRVAKAEADIAKNSHRSDLAARHGRLGGSIAALGESKGFGAGAGLATGAAGGALAMAGAGFQGTVEMQQFQTALTFASRELAGAFVPALKNLTALANIVRLLFGQMSESQQKVVAATTLTVGGLAAMNVALYRTTGVTLMGAAAGASRLATGGGAAGTGTAGAGGAAGALAGVPAGGKLPTAAPKGPPIDGGALHKAHKAAQSASDAAADVQRATSFADQPAMAKAVAESRKADAALEAARGAKLAGQEAMGASQLATAGGAAQSGSKLAKLGKFAGKLGKAVPFLGNALAIGTSAYEDNEEHGSLYGLSRDAGHSKAYSAGNYLVGGAAGALGLDNLGGTDARRDLKRERAKLKPGEFSFDEDKDATKKDRLYSLGRAAGYNKLASAQMMAQGSIAEFFGMSGAGSLTGVDARGDLRKEGFDKRLGAAYKSVKTDGMSRNDALTKSFGMVEGDEASKAKTIAGLAKTDPTWKPPADTDKPGDPAKKDGKTSVTPILPTLFSEAGSTWEEMALANTNSAASKGDGEDSTLGQILKLMNDYLNKQKPENPAS